MDLRHPLLAAVSLFLLLGCGLESVDSEEMPALEKWALGSPTLELGSLEGGPDSFSDIRSVALSPEGALHILLHQEQSIKVFGPSGDFLATIGRKGEGPGEFTLPNRLGFVGDTLWVLDGGADRVSLFTNGEFLRSEPYPEIPQFHPDRHPRIGAVAAGNSSIYVSDVRRLDQPSTTTTPVPMILEANGLFDTLAFLNADHIGGFLTQTTGGALRMVRPFVQPFQDQDLWTVAADGSFVLVVNRRIGPQGADPTYRVHRVGMSGDTVCSATFPYEPKAIPPAHLDSILDRMAGSSFSEDDVEDALFIPPHFPPVDRVVAGQDGTIWVATQPAQDGPMPWMVLSQNCEPVAEMEIGEWGELQIADGHSVWLLTTDEFDVPYLTRYEVSMGSGT